MRLLVAILMLCTECGVLAEIIPATNQCAWSHSAGIVGGIPPSSGTYTNLPTSVTTLAFNTAISNCPANWTIQLTNGDYNLAGINLRTGVRINGNGATTRIVSSDAIRVPGGFVRTNINIFGGSTNGSTNISLAWLPGPEWASGVAIWIGETNDPAYVTQCGWEIETNKSCAAYLDEPDGLGVRIRGQMVRVTAVSGSNVTYWPPLYSSYTRDPRAELKTLLTSGCGLSNLRYTNGVGVAFYATYAMDWWLTNVICDIGTGDQPFVQGFWTHRVTIQHCEFNGWANTASAISPYVKNEGWLVENNIFRRCNQTFLVVGGGGAHVFAYNYTESITNSTTAMIGETGGHGGHPMKVLYEGNVIWKFHADGVHGSGSHWTLFRNHIKGRKPGSTFGHGMVWIDQTNYWSASVGNVLGYSGIVTNDYGWQYEFESDASGAPPSTIILYRFGVCGYNEHTTDPYAKTSTIRHGNYDFLRNTLEWDAGIADHAPPTSLYLSFKPGWMGGLDWPGVGPDVTGYLSTYANAAQYRDANGGAEPPGVVPVAGAGVSGINLRAN